MMQKRPMTDYIDNQTPESLCKTIIARTSWRPGELVLEPARGEGNFYRHFPEFVTKDWCEIKEGRDFFAYWKQVDTVLTNPPFRNRSGGTNLFFPFLEHSLEVAKSRVIFLINHKCFISCKPNRLHKYERHGWVMTNLAIYSIKKWWGLYFLLTFEQGGKRTVEWDERAY
jgi:hypothetical protein